MDNQHSFQGTASAVTHSATYAAAHHAPAADYIPWLVYGGMAVVAAGFCLWVMLLSPLLASKQSEAWWSNVEIIFAAMIALGIASIGGGVIGYSLGFLSPPTPVWFVLAGIVLIILGRVAQDNFGSIYVPAPVPAPVQPDKTPSRQTVYGDARQATEREIHEALRDKDHSGNSGYLYED